MMKKKKYVGRETRKEGRKWGKGIIFLYALP
jgi:hypothetical protein